MKLGHMLGRRDRARTIAAAGGSLAAVLASLLGGLALVLFAARDLDLRIRLRRRPDGSGSVRG